MSRARARGLLWVAALLLVPLPYFVIAEGAVPVVRFAILAAIAAAYSGFVDGTGVAWALTMILISHVIVSAVVLAVLAVIVTSLIPERARRWMVPALIVVGFVFALASPVYRTPFDDERPRSGWIGLFQ